MSEGVKCCPVKFTYLCASEWPQGGMCDSQ